MSSSFSANPINDPFGSGTGSSGPIPGQVIQKWRWTPVASNTFTSGESVDITRVDITVDEDEELQFRGGITARPLTVPGSIQYRVYRDSSLRMSQNILSSTGDGTNFGTCPFAYTDRPPAGTYEYRVQCSFSGSVASATMSLDDTFWEITKVYMPESIYELQTSGNWVWS
jgi:hypothetical protein